MGEQGVGGGGVGGLKARCWRYYSLSLRCDVDTWVWRCLAVRYRYGFDIDKTIVEASLTIKAPI